MKIVKILLVGAALFWSACFAYAVTPALIEMSLEELMNVEITSVSKTPQNLSKTPAAVYVITNEELRRSGATTLPDALRGVPGVEVGRIDASTWGVSIRGFNDRFATKLLVLMDGRSVYSPLFSGAFWNVQDTLFEDIERIEVIRGPGGTIWGANAVNGIINIITKSSKQTQGVYTAGGYGSDEQGFADARYGGKVNENIHYRFYKKYYNRDSSINGADDWQSGKFGGRVDWDLDDENRLLVQGDYYGLYDYSGATVKRFFTSPLAGPYDRIEEVDSHYRGRNVITKYAHSFSKESDLSIQGYYDATYLDNPIFAEARETYDVDARYRFPVDVGVPQEIIIGTGYRYTSDETRGSFEVSFDPTEKSTDIISASIQDELKLIEDFLSVWVGSKFEDNDYSGFEFQPSARVAVYPDKRNTLWGSFTRAVRTPSRAGNDLILQTVRNSGSNTPLVVQTLGSDDIEAEILFAYELGVKSQVTDQLNADVAVFYNDYDDLISTNVGRTTTNLSTGISTLPTTFGNDRKAETYGAELSVKYHVTEKFRLTGAYNYLKIKFHPDPLVNQSQLTAEAPEEQSPNHQASGGVSLDLPWNLTFDTEVRYVGRLGALNIRDYVVADIRIAWKPNPTWEWSLVGLNLFSAEHFEFKTPAGFDFLGLEERTGPSVYGKIEAKF